MLSADDVKEEFLTCSVCTQEFDEEQHIPRVLPCLHTFCQECLGKVVKSETLVCPYCKTEYLLPSEGIYVFPKDTTRRNLIEFCRINSKEADVMCKDCPDDNIASDFCKECYIFMCMDCTHAHRRSLASRGHYVESVDKLQKQAQPTVFQRVLKCSQPGHEGQPLSFYCAKKGCEKLVCTSCTVCDHDKAKGHLIRNVKDIYSQKQTELKKIFKMLEDDVNWAKTTVQHSDQKKMNIDIKEYELEREIDTAFAVCQKELENRKEDLKHKMSSICAMYKTSMSAQIEKLLRFIEDVKDAKDFSEKITLHSDATEFLSLHISLYRRLKVLNLQRVKTSGITVDVPVFESTRMIADFQRVVKGLGQINSVASNPNRKPNVSKAPTELFLKTRGRADDNSPRPKLHTDVGILSPRSTNISRGQTDIVLNSKHKLPKIEDGQTWFGDVLCPEFSYDVGTVHQTRQVTNHSKTLRNQASKNLETSDRRLKRYRGVVGNRPFQGIGKYYFEVMVEMLVTKPVDNSNFVLEIGLCRKEDIDNGYYVYDQEHAWSFCLQHCEEHKQLCQWCRHNNRNQSHVPLCPVTMGTTENITYGFLLDLDRKRFSIHDCSSQKKIYCYHKVDVTQPLWPVFGCHWPSKMKIDMTLRSGRDIACPPHLLRSISMIV